MSDRDLPTIEGEVDFNYDEDKKGFGLGSRLVVISSNISEQGESKTTMSFVLGQKKDDDISVTFDTEELVQKIARAIAFGENYMKE